MSPPSTLGNSQHWPVFLFPLQHSVPKKKKHEVSIHAKFQSFLKLGLTSCIFLSVGYGLRFQQRHPPRKTCLKWADFSDSIGPSSIVDTLGDKMCGKTFKDARYTDIQIYLHIGCRYYLDAFLCPILKQEHKSIYIKNNYEHRMI